jgi:hypothetical protein
MPNNGEHGALEIAGTDTAVPWFDSEWHELGDGNIQFVRNEGQCEISSDVVGIDCTSNTLDPIFAHREYRPRFGSTLEATIGNQDYGAVVNFPGSFVTAPTTITFVDETSTNITGAVQIDDIDARGLVISHTASAASFSTFAGTAIVRP